MTEKHQMAPRTFFQDPRTLFCSRSVRYWSKETNGHLLGRKRYFFYSRRDGRKRPVLASGIQPIRGP
jgi:hypothetical protein